MIVSRILFAVAASALLASCFHDHGDGAARLEHWNASLAQEPAKGATEAEVSAFFLRHGLESQVLEKERSVIAIERDVESKGLVSTSIAMRCELDTSLQLDSCTASMLFTGP